MNTADAKLYLVNIMIDAYDTDSFLMVAIDEKELLQVTNDYLEKECPDYISILGYKEIIKVNGYKVNLERVD
jgi:hypothetical protein